MSPGETAAAPPSPVKPPNILVVEDDALSGEDLKIQLEHLGYAVPDIVSTGQRAIDAVERLQPDLVLMDVFLEGSMDGIDAAVAIHERFDTPIVYMSMYSGEDALERAKETQPFGYILKPYTERELRAVLSMALYKADLERKLKDSAWLSATLMTMQAAVVSTDAEGRVSLMNRAAEILLKVDLRNAKGQHLSNFIDLRDAVDRDLLPHYLRDVLQNRAFVMRDRDLYLVQPDGGRVPVGLTINPIQAGTMVKGAAVLLQEVLPDPTRGRRTTGVGVREGGDANYAADAQMLRNDLDAFSQAVSHDVRAPLRAMLGFSEALLLDHGAELTPQAAEHARRIADGARRMDQLLQSLVTYFRIGREPPHLQTVSVARIIASARTDLSTLIGERAAEIEVREPLPEICAHAATLRRVFVELLRNALIFTDENVQPRLSIWAETKGQNVRVWVEDNGIGVAPEYQDKIFLLLEKLHGGTRYPGVGVGLAIVNRAVHWMGGRVGVESRGGDGSCFWVELKRAEDAQGDE